jgi:hypothetical protein
MNDVVVRLLRELPDTDKDRYDIAFERGRAQARSSLLFGGMTLGLVAGALGLFLLDPVAGSGRRAQLARRAKAFLNDLQRTIDRGRSRASDVDSWDAAAATNAASPKHEVRISPRSAASSVARGTDATTDATDRVPIAAGTAEH